MQFGPNWKKINALLESCSTIQLRSFAQKLFIKLNNCKDEKIGIDFTLDSIKNI